MGIINRGIYMTAKYMTEYRLLKKIFFKINPRRLVDRGMGLLARFCLAHFSKIDKKQIFITTFQGDYTCNPKYITQELLKDPKDYKIIWGISKGYLERAENEIDNRIQIVRKYTFEFYRLLYSSRLCIANSGACLGRPFYNKKGQVLMQTWHGSMGIKRIDPETYQGKDKKFWISMTMKTAKATNYMLSNSTYENEIFHNSFWPKSEMLKYGHPRNDLLINSTKEHCLQIKHRILQNYNLDEDYNILLYAPTIRDAHTFDCYQLPDKELTEALVSKFSGKWAIFKRMHPILKKYGTRYSYRNKEVKCIDATDYPDMQELMIVADIAVTDYSSWIFDYILTKRKGFIYATDINEYNNSRGFYYPLEETPFLIAASGAELVNNVVNFDIDIYNEKLGKFLIARGCAEDGHASERTVEKIHEIMRK